jgi:DNA-directed RNA polymerase specialized sigma24 family protein
VLDSPVSQPGDFVAELYRTHAVELVRIGLLLLGDQQSAEDVVQDARAGPRSPCLPLLPRTA